MANSRMKFMRIAENVFAVVVVMACMISIMTSFARKHPPLQKQNRRTLNNILKRERENFYIAMHRTDVKRTPNDTQNFPKVTSTKTPHYNDDVKQWFLDRNLVKYHASKPHPHVKPELINNINICNSDPVDIVIYFQSYWDNFERRTILRETWASTSIFNDIIIKTIFILGKPDKSKQEDQLKINNENFVHRDIIQGDFVDSFANLTMKSILALRWINEHCIQTKYVLKADDDMFVNIFAVVEYLITQIYEKKKVVACHVKEANTSQLIRDKNSKWYVPETVWKGRTHYPKFCSGYTAVFTSDLVPQLYKISFSSPYFSVDDGYLFGLLMQNITDVTYMDIQDHMTLNQKTAFEEYTGSGPLVHVAANAWEKGYLEKFWQATLSKLTPWAREHANIATVQKQITDSL